MSGVDELVAWLTGVLDAIEQTASMAARGGPGMWRQSGYPSHLDDHDDVVVYDEGSPSEVQFAHIALNDPRSALARVETERRVIALALEVGDNGNIDGDTLELLAYGHRYDASGYDPAWAPADIGP